MKQNRVVVTGLGVVTPIGMGIEDFWKGLKEGRNGISKITRFDTKGFRSDMAGEIHDFNPEDWVDEKSLRHMDRFTQFAIAAATMALEDAGLTSFPHDPTRIGVIMGSGIGGSETIEQGQIGLSARGPRAIHPFFVPKVIINMAPCLVSIQFGFKGPISALSMACSTL